MTDVGARCNQRGRDGTACGSPAVTAYAAIRSSGTVGSPVAYRCSGCLRPPMTVENSGRTVTTWWREIPVPEAVVLDVLGS